MSNTQSTQSTLNENKHKKNVEKKVKVNTETVQLTKKQQKEAEEEFAVNCFIIFVIVFFILKYLSYRENKKIIAKAQKEYEEKIQREKDTLKELQYLRMIHMNVEKKID